MNKTDWILALLVFVFVPSLGLVVPQNTVDARPTNQVPVVTPVAAKTWYTFDINHSRCFASDMSPADRIRDYQSWGVKAQADQLSSGAVQVGDDSSYYTYFPSMAACEASLPRSQAIPSDLE